MPGAKERSGDRVKSGIRTREGQVDPCNVLAVRFGSGWRSFRGGKQRLALATSGSWLPRGPFPEPEFRGKQRDNLEIPSLSALPGRPRRSTSLPSSLGFLLSLSLYFFLLVSSRHVASRRAERPRRRRKSSTGVIRRYRARYPGYRTAAVYPLTHRQCVPLSYQLIAGRSLSPWDVFSHGLHFPRSLASSSRCVPFRVCHRTHRSPLRLPTLRQTNEPTIAGN